jgi:hypothetical protein
VAPKKKAHRKKKGGDGGELDSEERDHVVGVPMDEVSHGEGKIPEDLHKGERGERRPELRPGERARSFFAAPPRSRGASESEPENDRAHDEGEPIGRRSDQENQASRPGHLAYERGEPRKSGDGEGDSRGRGESRGSCLRRIRVDASAGPEEHCRGREDVQGRGPDRGEPQAGPGEERDPGCEASHDGARGVERVEDSGGASRPVRIAAKALAKRHRRRDRSPHQGRGQDEKDRGGDARERRERGDEEREQDGERGDADLERRIRAWEVRRRRPVDPSRGESSSDSETQHEDAEDRRDRLERRAEDGRELPHPDHLIDEGGGAGEKEGEREGPMRRASSHRTRSIVSQAERS